jgi:hypothetical protein
MGLGALAASRSGGSEKVKGFSVIFSLGFVCISSDFFEGRTEGGAVFPWIP